MAGNCNLTHPCVAAAKESEVKQSYSILDKKLKVKSGIFGNFLTIFAGNCSKWENWCQHQIKMTENSIKIQFDINLVNMRDKCSP